MNRGGIPNIWGVNSQLKAAFSLFLQHLARENFESIILESPKLADFILVFKDRHRIICESKYRKNPLSLTDLRKILDVMIDGKKLKQSDEILVITNGASSEVRSLIDNYRYYKGQFKTELTSSKHNFKKKHFEILPQVNIWEVTQEVNDQGILLLMARVINLEGAFWIPIGTLKEWSNDLLMSQIYKGSQAGKKITKKYFLKKIAEKKYLHLENLGSNYETVKKYEEKNVDDIIKTINTNPPPKKDVCAQSISNLAASPTLHYFVLDKLRNKTNLQLDIWDSLWMATVQSAFSSLVFQIFENNLNDVNSQKYVIQFIKTIIGTYYFNYFRDDFFKQDICDLCRKIYTTSNNYSSDILQIIKQLFELNTQKFMYEKYKGDNKYDREVVAELLAHIYGNTKDTELKSEIVQFVISTFNLTQDDGKFWYYSPTELYVIIYDHVSSDPSTKIPWITGVLVDQFTKFYSRFGKKLKFNGWDHMGSGISQSGSDFSITDKHFVWEIIEPSIRKLGDREKIWEYITANLISRNSNEVSEIKPDFLNRACIKILIEEYKEGSHQEDAFHILCDFIKMRKGIPWKPDLIFQEVAANDLPDDKKWALVKFSLDEYDGLPANVFVEKIVTSLGSSSIENIKTSALETIVGWAKNPDYRKNRSMGSYDVIDSVFRLVNNPDTIDGGVEILKSYLNSEIVQTGKDTYGSWDIAKAVALVIEKKEEVGIPLLKEINEHVDLSTTQQLVICSTLEDLPENSNVLVKVYDSFLEPLLKELSTNTKFENRFKDSHAREQLASFAEKLAKSGEYSKSLKIVSFLVSDSDPPKDGSNSPDDPKGEFNKHKMIEEGKDDFSIDTVRGRCAWALRHFALLPARKFYKKAVPLVKKLSEDSNNYIRLQATFALTEFVRNRDTYIANTEPKERFVDEKTASDVAEIALAMLRNSNNQRLPAIMRGLVHVFGNMRAVDTILAKEIIMTFIDTGFDEVLEDVAPLLVYFAIFRKGDFAKWPWKPLSPFIDQEFVQILKTQIKSGKNSLKYTLSWQFWQLPKEGHQEVSSYKKELFNISVDYFKLFIEQGYDHDVWQDIYYFIEDFFPYEFEACYDLWKRCLVVEKSFILKESKKKGALYKINWWPHSYNGRVLLRLLENKLETDFLKWLNFLSDYPGGVSIGNDIDEAIIRLKDMPKSNKQIERIYNKLFKRDPKYYQQKQMWLNAS